MAISFVSSASAAATTATITTPSRGNIIIVFAYSDTGVNPVVDSSYNSVTTYSSSGNAVLIGYKFSDGTETNCGTWANTTIIQAVVYSGSDGIARISGAANSASTTDTIPSFPLASLNGNSWIVAFAASKQTGSQGVPSAVATTSRGTRVGTNSSSIVADTNGGIWSWPGATSSNTTSVISVGVAIELKSDSSIAGLIDPFNQTTLNSTAFWAPTTAGATTIDPSTTGCSFTLPNPTTSSDYAYIESMPNYNVTGCRLSLEVTSVPSTSSLLSTSFILQAAISNDDREIQCHNGTLYAYSNTNGVTLNVASVTYNPVTMRFWSIREAGGTFYWEYSADGVSWTTFGTNTDPFVGSVACFPHIVVNSSGAVSSPGLFTFRNLNITPTASRMRTNAFARLL